MRPETAFVLIRQIRKIGCLHPHDNRKSAGPDKNRGWTSIKKFLLPLNKLIILLLIIRQKDVWRLENV